MSICNLIIIITCIVDQIHHHFNGKNRCRTKNQKENMKKIVN